MTIYTDKSKAVEEFKKRFSNTALLPFLCNLDSDTLFAKLLAAEEIVRDRLRILLEPTKVLTAEDTSQADIDALNATNPPTAYVLDPGYDYTADFFQNNAWGMLVTRRKPVISVESYKFVYLDQRTPVFTVPAGWIRMDRKYGHIRLLPTADAALLPLNAFLLTAMSAGRVIPSMIHLSYTAGIKDIRKEYPGLYEFIFRVAALELIMDTFPSGSDSVSADGLSQSMSFDITQWLDASKGIITNEYKRWSDLFNGVRVMVA